MAMRRALGRGIQAGSEMLGKLFEQQDQEKEIAKRQTDLAMLQAKLKDMAIPDELAKGVLQKWYESNPNSARENYKIKQDPRDITGPIAEGIAKTDSMNKALTPEDVVGQYRSAGGNMNGVTNWQGTPNPSQGKGTLSSRNIGTEAAPDIQQLLAQRKAHNDALLAEASVPTEKVTIKNPDGSTTDKFVSKRDAATYQTGLSAPQEGANKGIEATAAAPGIGAGQAAIERITRPGATARAGAMAGAEAKARLPFELQLAEKRANIALLDKQAFDEWKIAHPHATAQELTRRSSATTALATSSEIRSMIDEMEKRNMLGPLQGRLTDLEASRIKTEDVFKTPEDARLAAQFLSKTKLLTSLLANTHAGQRGAAGKDSMNRFEQIFNGIGDKANTLGQLDAMDELMRHYQEKPGSDQPDPDVLKNTKSPAMLKLEALRNR